MRDVSFLLFFSFSSRFTVPYDCVFVLNCGRIRLPYSTFGSLSKSTFYVLNFHVGNGVRFYVCSFLFPFYHEIISYFFPSFSLLNFSLYSHSMRDVYCKRQGL